MSETENKHIYQSPTLQAPASGKEYEMPYFLTADIAESGVDNAVNELKLLIAENGGENVAPEAPKKRWLAYKINKQNESYFGVIYFSINTEGLEKIKKSLMLNKKILRYMILNKLLKSKQIVTPVKSINESALTPMPAPTQSFDQKLENILNR